MRLNNFTFLAKTLPIRFLLLTISALIGVTTLGLLRPTAAQAQAQEIAELKITLPPRAVFQPKQLRFEGNLYNFTDLTVQCDSSQSRDCSKFPTPIVALGKNDPTDTRGDYYIITISGMKKGQGTGVARLPRLEEIIAKLNRYLSYQKALAYTPPPATLSQVLPKGTNNYKLKLVFDENVATEERLSSLISYLIEGKQTTAQNFFLGDHTTCNPPGSDNPTALCFRTKVELSAEDRSVAPQYLREYFSLVGVHLEGSVVGGGQLNNFRIINRQAIVVGGNINPTVRTPTADQKLNDYLKDSTTALRWEKVGDEITRLYNEKANHGAKVELATGRFGLGSTWNLNAKDNKPTTVVTDAFSTPPEGKLWKGLYPNQFIFDGDVTFKGSGTLVFTGDVFFKGKVNCQPGTRLGVITTGNITFEANPASVQCGAYVSLKRSDRVGGGDINFDGKKQVTSGRVKGIFIAQNDIILPGEKLTGPFFIAYDAHFASQPTVLFQELLKVIFSTAS